MRKNNLKKISYLLYWILIFIVSISMLIYGIAKPIQFKYSANELPLSSMNGHQVMWSFYGYSKSLPIIIGIFQVIGAISLLIRPTRLFGCFLLSAILVNIIIQDYIYEIVALKTAILYQLMVFGILIIDKEHVIQVLKLAFKASHQPYANKLVQILALILAFLFIIFETRLIS